MSLAHNGPKEFQSVPPSETITHLWSKTVIYRQLFFNKPKINNIFHFIKIHTSITKGSMKFQNI